jgi:hypothetical protein
MGAAIRGLWLLTPYLRLCCCNVAVQVVVDKAVGGEQAQLADLTPGSSVEVSSSRGRQWP